LDKIDGIDYWLADGFHRVYAYKLSEVTEIDCDVREGTRLHAIIHSVGANAKHGLRRTNADKRKSVQMILDVYDEIYEATGEKWSNVKIADVCCVSEGTIRNYIKETDSSLRNLRSECPTTYTDRFGNISTMNTANIGKPKPAEPEPEEKHYSLHCIADDPEYMNYKNEVLTPE